MVYLPFLFPPPPIAGVTPGIGGYDWNAPFWPKWIRDLFDPHKNENADGGDSCPVPDTIRDRITKGNTDIRIKPGNADTANGDFDSLNPRGVSDKGNGVGLEPFRMEAL